MEVAQGGREGGRGRSYGAPRTDQPNQGAELSYSCSVESGALAQLNQIEPVDRRCFRRAVWAHTSSTTPVRYGGSDRHRTRDEVAGHHHLPSRTWTTATNQAASLVSATLHSAPRRRCSSQEDAQAVVPTWSGAAGLAALPGDPEDPYAPGKIYCPGYPRAERLGSHTRDLMVWSLVLWWPSRAFAPCLAIAGSHKTHAQSSPGSCYGLSSVASSAHSQSPTPVSQSPTPVPKVHIEGAFRETHEPVSTPLTASTSSDMVAAACSLARGWTSADGTIRKAF
jgi:hypothetical protein